MLTSISTNRFTYTQTGPIKPVDATASQNSQDKKSEASAAKAAATAVDERKLSAEEQREVEELKKRDREVRAHEAAHKAAAGNYANSAPTYEHERGPDGRNYATGGEVGIDSSEVHGDPEATVRKAEQIQRAALAPADPSAQDRQVAAEATAMATEARAEMREEQKQESESSAATALSSQGNQATDLYRRTAIGPGPAPGGLLDINA